MNGFQALFVFKDINLLKRVVSMVKILDVKQILLFSNRLILWSNLYPA